MGPSAVRAAGLNHMLKNLGHQVEDTGNIHVRLPEEQHFDDLGVGLVSSTLGKKIL